MIGKNLDLKTNQCNSSNVNYWKEIEKDATNELQNIKGLILLTHNSAEFIDLLEFLKNLRKGEFLNVLYISLVRSYEYMKNALDFFTLDNKRMIFIDCVSGYAFPMEDRVDHAFYHKPPQNLNEMKKIIQFGISKSNPDLIIIDSLSQFINFSQSKKDELDDLYNFLKSIKKSTINFSQNTIMLLYDTRLSTIKNLPKKEVDMIFKIEKIEKL